LEVAVRMPEHQQIEPVAGEADHTTPAPSRPSVLAAWRAAQRPPLPGPSHHTVQFYEDEAFLCDHVAAYVAAGLQDGEPVCVVATADHLAAFAAGLTRRGADVAGARARGQLVWLDAHEMLSTFMVGEMPEWQPFRDTFGDVLDKLSATAGRGDPRPRVRVYGEMVDVLWRSGRQLAALRVEDMWNDLARLYPMALLCAYDMGNFRHTADAKAFREVCDGHTHVLPTEEYPQDEGAAPRLREISELQQRARALENEIEQRKQLEHALREALVREQDAREEAERSVRYNEMFAGMLGHDLRNPLSAITTGANYIARLNSGPKATRAATRILASAERMARMIEQLLDFTQIRVGGGLPLQPIRLDLEEVCCRVKDELEAANPDRSIIVEVTGDVAGEWDHDRLLQVFANLVGNAIHHGGPGTPVSIRCDGSDRAFVSIQVHNEGVVPSEVLPVLFEPFRGNARYQRTTGLGLGLFITQQIVSAHGASINVVSDPATGTTFHLRLPRTTPARGRTPAPPLH
jgi:signal transduction histidine kinase